MSHPLVIRQITDGTSQVAIGDSIAEGLMQVDGSIAGSTRVGAGPSEVLQKVTGLVQSGALNGKKVVLSTGLSNAYDEETGSVAGVRNALKDGGVIEQQLRLLQESGAKVEILGVGNEHQALSGFNARLKELAEKYGFTFVSLPSTASDPHKMHPDSKTLLARVNAQTQDDYRAPTVKQPSFSGDPGIVQTKYQGSFYGDPGIVQAKYVQPGGASQGEDLMKGADLTHTGYDKARAIQELIKKADPEGKKYDLGTFGAKKDGVDGIVGDFTTKAIHKWEDDHGVSRDASADEVLAAMRKAGGTQQDQGKGAQLTAYNFDLDTNPRPLATPGHPAAARKTQTTLT